MFPLQAILADHWVKSAVHYEDALATLGASNLFERQGIDILTMAFDLPVLDIPYMRVCKVGAFVRCTVYASEAAQGNHRRAIDKKF